MTRREVDLKFTSIAALSTPSCDQSDKFDGSLHDMRKTTLIPMIYYGPQDSVVNQRLFDIRLSMWAPPM
jgi:hypothetical protein